MSACKVYLSPLKGALQIKCIIIIIIIIIIVDCCFMQHPPDWSLHEKLNPLRCCSEADLTFDLLVMQKTQNHGHKNITSVYLHK